MCRLLALPVCWLQEETIVNEFAFVAEQDRVAAKLVNVNVSVNTQHRLNDAESASAQRYVQLSQVPLVERELTTLSEGGSAAHKNQEKLAPQSYTTMQTASHLKEEAGAIGDEYITMHSASHLKEEAGGGEEYITMHSASRSKETEVGTSAEDSAPKRSRRGSSWLLSNPARPSYQHHSLPRRGYSLSRTESCVSGKEDGAKERADSMRVKRSTSVSGASHHYEQLRGRSTSQASSNHYEVLSDEIHTPSSFDDGYDRVRPRPTTGRDSIYWNASSGPVLPPRQLRKPTADSAYINVHPQVSDHRPPPPPLATMPRLYERTPGLPESDDSDTTHNYYNLDDTRTL